jgi:hypothetical protein
LLRWEFPEFLSANSCNFSTDNALCEKGSGNNEIISEHFHFSLQQKHTEGLLRHFVPRNDREMALLLDLSLRAERNNLMFDNARFTLEYKKRLYVGDCS